ncbi:MAG: class I SAM-dependent methyltransferase [Acidobacteriota bacterium]
MSDSKIQASADYWDEHNRAPSEDVTYWLSVLDIRRRVNRLLTDDPDTLYIQHFIDSFRDRWPVDRVLSVGCGIGELERGVAGQDAARHVDGIDVSPASLAEAARLAADQGLSDAIHYHRATATEWLGSTGRSYDLVFFHGVLHHLEHLEEILALAGSSVQGGEPGLIYIDEYCGPSRDEWTDAHLEIAERFFQRVAADDRRTPHVWPPIAIEDPTEMIRSSDIEGTVRRELEIVEYRPYWGNVVMPLINAIRASRLGRYTDLLIEAWDEEMRLAATGAFEKPLYAAFVAAHKG